MHNVKKLPLLHYVSNVKYWLDDIYLYELCFFAGYLCVKYFDVYCYDVHLHY